MRSLKKRTFKLISNRDTPILESTWRLYIYAGPSLLRCINTPAERVSATDRLGLNAVQYARELHEPHLIPFLESFDISPDYLMLVADGASWHKGPENTKLRKDSGQSTHCFLGYPTHQILTSSKINGPL